MHTKLLKYESPYLRRGDADVLCISNMDEAE